MLFSREDVARFVNQNFEPVWESVRPVPIVRIDFGNGTVITRTLHGNIASTVCTAEGDVVDVLPGIYTPAVYLERLRAIRLMANFAASALPGKREAVLRNYHQAELAAALAPKPAPGLRRMKDITKMVAVENRLERVVAAGGNPRAAAVPPEEVNLSVPQDLADWKLLAEDARRNEQDRRRQIHTLLAGAGLVKLEAITRRLYKEVLHADLDDPYLGLGNTLFANYPFVREDGKR